MYTGVMKTRVNYIRITSKGIHTFINEYVADPKAISSQMIVSRGS